MEEFILDESTNAHKIRLHGVPQSMRYMYIRQSRRHINTVFINYDTLPAGLEEIRATRYSKSHKLKLQIISVGVPGAVTIQTEHQDWYPKIISKYMATFRQKLR